MLEVGRERLPRRASWLSERINPGARSSRIALPFDDAQFDALSFTYLLRYVEDRAATMRELSRVTPPAGDRSLEFGVPPSPVWRVLWELYVRAGLPVLGHASRRAGTRSAEFWARRSPRCRRRNGSRALA